MEAFKKFRFNIPGAEERWEPKRPNVAERVLCIVGKITVAVWTYEHETTFHMDCVVHHDNDEGYNIVASTYGLSFDPLMFRSLALEWLGDRL